MVALTKEMRRLRRVSFPLVMPQTVGRQSKGLCRENAECDDPSGDMTQRHSLLLLEIMTFSLHLIAINMTLL
jgi:hypothetical protein